MRMGWEALLVLCTMKNGQEKKGPDKDSAYTTSVGCSVRRKYCSALQFMSFINLEVTSRSLHAICPLVT